MVNTFKRNRVVNSPPRTLLTSAMVVPIRMQAATNSVRYVSQRRTLELRFVESRRTARLVQPETYRKTGNATMREETDHRTDSRKWLAIHDGSAGSGNARLIRSYSRLPKL